MKNKLIFGLLLISFLGFGQSNRFVYEYQFKIDSLNRDSIIKENMVLDITPKGSKFYSYVQYVSDSLTNAMIKKSARSGSTSMDMSGIPFSKVPFEDVLKEYPSYQAIFETSEPNTSVALEGKPKFNWKIENAKDKILGYEVQKATTDFGGRKWIAWFAPDIPIQDGPYRFYGLPGLILKIEDTKGDHVFTAIASKNLKQPIDFKFKKSGDAIVVTNSQFTKLWDNYKKDPYGNINQGASAGAEGTAVLVTANGQSGKDAAKEMEEDLKKQNNFIELDLYK